MPTSRPRTHGVEHQVFNSQRLQPTGDRLSFLGQDVENKTIWSLLRQATSPGVDQIGSQKDEQAQGPQCERETQALQDQAGPTSPKGLRQRIGGPGRCRPGRQQAGEPVTRPTKTKEDKAARARKPRPTESPSLRSPLPKPEQGQYPNRQQKATTHQTQAPGRTGLSSMNGDELRVLQRPKAGQRTDPEDLPNRRPGKQGE